MTRARVICIQGPTASGKSELAERLAAGFGGEIVSADSMQVYRGMDIGTAKMPLAKRACAYHCIDIVDPGRPYSAALFQSDARAAFSDIEDRGLVPVLCGGTGLYVRAALDEMDFAKGEQADNPVRDKYTALAEELGCEGLYRLLVERDPQSAALLHPNNVRRVIRAFEMLEGGESYAERKNAFKTVPAHVQSVKIALNMDREKLYEKINKRVDLMFELGLVQEVRSLMERGFRQGLTAPQAIGYKEVVSALDGEMSMEEAAAQIKQASRRYAKRQLTWLRSDSKITWLDSGDGITDALVEQAAKLCEEQLHRRWKDDR